MNCWLWTLYGFCLFVPKWPPDRIHQHQMREKVDPAYHNTRSLLQRIDQLPQGPGWSCTALRIQGDLTDAGGAALFEDVELWRRNPVECVKDLLQNPAFKDHLAFAPQRIFKKSNYTNREYHKMWGSDWWWQRQVSSLHGIPQCFPLLKCMPLAHASQRRDSRPSHPGVRQNTSDQICWEQASLARLSDHR